MSFPNIPDVDPTITLTFEETIVLLLASVAFEELGLAHIINAEAEKIQYVLGTLVTRIPPPTPPPRPVTLEELLELNSSVNLTLRHVLKNQLLLQFKLEDTLSFASSITPTEGP